MASKKIFQGVKFLAIGKKVHFGCWKQTINGSPSAFQGKNEKKKIHVNEIEEERWREIESPKEK